MTEPLVIANATLLSGDVDAVRARNLELLDNEVFARAADGWHVRIFAASGFLDPDKPIRKYTRKEHHDFLYKEPTKVKVEKLNLTYEGLVPRIQKSFLSRPAVRHAVGR